MNYLLLALLLLTGLPRLRAQTFPAPSGRDGTISPDSGRRVSADDGNPLLQQRVARPPSHRWQTSAGPWKSSKYRVVAEKYKPEQASSGGLLRVQVLDYLARGPIPGAWVTLTEMRTQFTRQGSTSETGSIAQPLPPGLYTLHISSIGFHELTTEPFAVQQGYVLRLEVLLGFES